MKKTHVEIGCTYEDKITGFIGIATGLTWWHTGCITAGLQAPVLEGKVPALEWFDDDRLVEVDEGEKKAQKIVPTGGPHDAPPDSTRREGQ